MKYLIIKSLRFKPAARRTKAAQSELRRGSIWHGKTKNKILQSLSFSMFFVNFKKIMYQQHPATVRNPFFLNFKCQPGTGRKLAQMMRARTPVRHCQYGNLKMTATDVNDVKIMKFDINWCRRWSCSNSGVKCDDMCCLWYHFSVLQPLQFVVLLATFSAVASESGAQHRYDFFCFEICALLAIGPPLNSIYIPSSTVHVFGTSWFCGPCRGKLYIPKKLQNQLETQPKLRCNGPERLRLNQVENSNLGGAGAWNRYKQIQTDSNRFKLQTQKNRFCCIFCLEWLLLPLPRTRFGRCKKSSVWWGWRHANPKFRVQTGRVYTSQNQCAALLDGNVTFGYGNSTESHIFPNFCDWSFLEEKHMFKEHKFLKGRLLRSKCCVCQKQCICSHTYSS